MKYLCWFIVSCLLTNVVQAQTLRWSDSSRLGRPFAKDPSVIRFHDHYFLYFSLPAFDPQLAPTNAPAGWSIGIAESTNLLDWTKVGELWPEQPCESKGICAPGARVLNGRVHLFYQTYGNGPKDAICHADSADGIHFTRDPSNPVFHATGFWNNGRAIDAEVFADRGYLLLFLPPATRRARNNCWASPARRSGPTSAGPTGCNFATMPSCARNCLGSKVVLKRPPSPGMAMNWCCFTPVPSITVRSKLAWPMGKTGCIGSVFPANPSSPTARPEPGIPARAAIPGTSKMTTAAAICFTRATPTTVIPGRSHLSP